MPHHEESTEKPQYNMATPPPPNGHNISFVLLIDKEFEPLWVISLCDLLTLYKNLGEVLFKG